MHASPDRHPRRDPRSPCPRSGPTSRARASASRRTSSSPRAPRATERWTGSVSPSSASTGSAAAGSRTTALSLNGAERRSSARKVQRRRRRRARQVLADSDSEWQMLRAAFGRYDVGVPQTDDDCFSCALRPSPIPQGTAACVSMLLALPDATVVFCSRRRPHAGESHEPAFETRVHARLGAPGAAARPQLFPWLHSPRAAQNRRRRSCCLFFTPHGTIWEHLRADRRRDRLRAVAHSEPLSAQREHIVVVDGISIEPARHDVPQPMTMPAIFTGSPIDTDSTRFMREDHGACFGWNTAESVDQIHRRQPEADEPVPHDRARHGSPAGSHPAIARSTAGPPARSSRIDHPVRACDKAFAAADPT